MEGKHPQYPSRSPAPLSLPGTGDIIVEPDEILAKKCGDKCGGLARCSPANSPTCGDVNICKRHTCTSDSKPGGCYPSFECDRHTCTGVTIKPATETVQMGAEGARLRKQLASHLAPQSDTSPGASPLN